MAETAEMTEVMEAPEAGMWRHKAKVVIMGALGTLMLALPVSAEIDLTNITALIDDVVDMMPSFLDLIIAAAPIIIAMAIIGFILAFLKDILRMFKLG